MNNQEKKKILVLVEGEKTDIAVMQKLFEIYHELDAKYQIVSYCTNIYTLYQEFFKKDEVQDSLDLLQVLKSKEKAESKKGLFDVKYTDVLLIFDLDPQDPLFAHEKIRQLQEYFCESSDMGKLYLNYPMIEAFYHMKEIPDLGYLKKIVSLDELKQRTYKERVHKETKGNDYRKFISNRKECSTVILQNIEKIFDLLNIESTPSSTWTEIDFLNLLNTQLTMLNSGYVHVLCTCVIYIYDYNSRLLFS